LRLVKATTTILLLSAIAASAAPKDLPKQVVSDAKFRGIETPTATLPHLLREALLAQDEFSRGTDTLPETLVIRSIDLNSDGSPEYIVDSRQGYSGGTAHIIFERQQVGYESIGYFQGGIRYLAPRVNGFYQIVVVVREGSYVLRYTSGEYHPVR